MANKVGSLHSWIKRWKGAAWHIDDAQLSAITEDYSNDPINNTSTDYTLLLGHDETKVGVGSTELE